MPSRLALRNRERVMQRPAWHEVLLLMALAALATYMLQGASRDVV